MKTIVRRALGVVLALGMTVGVLSGCGQADPVQEVMGYSSSTVLFTVNGKDVTAGDYFFWLANQMDSAASYLGMFTEATDENSIWDTVIDETQGTTAADSLKQSAQLQAVAYSIIAAKGEENGYTYTDEDKAAYQEELTSVKEQLGGEEAFQTWLKSSCTTEEGIEHISSISYINDHMTHGMFRDGSEDAPTAETLTAYADTNDLLCAKHILLLTKDMTTNEAYSQEQKDAQLAKAQDLLAQLQAVTDPAQLEPKFDELMNANSEDTGLAANPDGYTFTAGTMTEVFETATRELAPGQISDIVESEFGYHIILRLDPAQVAAVRDKWETAHMSELTQQWVEEAEIETTETYDQLSAKDFYEKLTAYRTSLTETTESESTDTQTDAQTEGSDTQTDGTDAAQTDGTDAAQTEGTDAQGTETGEAGEGTDGEAAGGQDGADAGAGEDAPADGTTEETPAQ